VRAYGLLLHDIVARTHAAAASSKAGVAAARAEAEAAVLEALVKLVSNCVRSLPLCRPTFADIVGFLHQQKGLLV
jgi:hypothetical protein